VLPFQNAVPTPAGDWRHIVRFGLNVASYKFALGQALLELAARQQTFVPLTELAVPYAARLCEHLQVEDLESTQLTEATVRLGFANVIDAFHISRGMTVTCAKSGISSWPATGATPPKAPARPPPTGCPG